VDNTDGNCIIGETAKGNCPLQIWVQVVGECDNCVDNSLGGTWFKGDLTIEPMNIGSICGLNGRNMAPLLRRMASNRSKKVQRQHIERIKFYGPFLAVSALLIAPLAQKDFLDLIASFYISAIVLYFQIVVLIILMSLFYFIPFFFLHQRKYALFAWIWLFIDYLLLHTKISFPLLSLSHQYAR